MKQQSTLLIFCIFFLQPVSLAQQFEQMEFENPVAKNIFKSINQLDKNNTIKLKKQKIVRNSTIINLYQKTNYQPLWNDAKNRADLIDVLENAYYDGLYPQDYHIDFIKQYNQNIYFYESDKNKAKADIVMTHAALAYALHMLQGKLQPTALYPSWNYRHRPLPDSIEYRLMHRLKTQTLKEEVNQLRPDLPLYLTLRNWFIHFDSMQRNQTAPKPVFSANTTLKIGDYSVQVSNLKKRLNVTASLTDSLQANLFDEDLEVRLKEFQLQNGLEPDGIAGPKTFAKLNMSIQQKMDILRVNMERCRWLKRENHQEMLVVNIADFNLYYLKDQQLFYNTKVVVGKEQQQTPAFEASLKYLVFNPTWVVPYSIATEEILPLVQQDSTYLDRNQMFLSVGDSIIDHCKIDFTVYTENDFPFVITQEAGLRNPLGLVKFIFPNEHAVYLHDTPAKAYFAETNRTFSHGCVRVEHALHLAELLLDKEGYTSIEIDSLLLTKETHQIYLKKPIPVMLMYWTCYEREGQLFFRNDIYSRDEKILAELKNIY